MEQPDTQTEKSANSLVVADQELILFENSHSLIQSMVRDLQQAQKRIWLECYMIVDDAAGQALAEVIRERAAQGVEVRVLYDAVGSLTTPNEFFHSLEIAGAQVHAYHSLWESLWRFSFFRIFNRRDHRKLLAIDDQICYFGGMNIVDLSGLNTLQDVKNMHLPMSAGWRDVHVRLVGSKQKEVAQVMDRLWRHVHRLPNVKPSKWNIDALLSSTQDSISFFDFEPLKFSRRAQRMFVPLIHKARKSITLAMAYFIPIGRILSALIKARRRGVKVRVIVPAVSDVQTVRYASRHLYASLLKKGIRIYERQNQMLHSKVMIVDGVWSVIGSCNLDPRSLRVNLEFSSLIRSINVATALLRMLRHDLRHSHRITPEFCLQRSWRERLLDQVAWSFRRFL